MVNKKTVGWLHKMFYYNPGNTNAFKPDKQKIKREPSSIYLSEKHNHLSPQSNTFYCKGRLKILHSPTFNKGHSHNMYTLIFPLIFTLLQCNKSQSLTGPLKLAFLTKSHNLRNINHVPMLHLSKLLNGHTFNWVWHALKAERLVFNKNHIQFLCTITCLQWSCVFHELFRRLMWIWSQSLASHYKPLF